MLNATLINWAASAFFATAIPIMITWLVNYLRSRGITVDEKQRALLHQALLTGARVVVAKFGVNLKDQPKEISSSMIEDVIDHARMSSPGAMKHFDLSPDKISTRGAGVLDNLAISKIQEVVVGEAAPGAAQAKAAMAREKKK